MLFLDLDRFKIVNDSLGHLAGDALLVALSQRLASCLRTDDTVARLGGDEFAILLDDIEDEREASRVADRIQQELRNPFVLDGHEVFSTASIGIAFGGPTDRRPEELLRDADTAMYRAKALGRDRHEIFDEAMHARAVAALTLESDLRRGLERGELRLLYQPIVSLQSGRTVGFEALVRWQHPERGLLAAADFVPLAEETGLIVPVGHWVMEEACRAARACRDAGAAPLPISVNLCAREFTHGDLVARMRALLDRHGLGADCIRVEITESLIMEDPEAAIARCLVLREMGVGIEIDDFGTGYSSLSSLRRFPVDALKIDRSFVLGVHERPEDTEIVRAIVSLAAALRLGVVAEGVETAEQAAALRGLGCTLAQGHFFAVPLDRDEAFARVREQPARLNLKFVFTFTILSVHADAARRPGSRPRGHAPSHDALRVRRGLLPGDRPPDRGGGHPSRGGLPPHRLRPHLHRLRARPGARAGLAPTVTVPRTPPPERD